MKESESQSNQEMLWQLSMLQNQAQEVQNQLNFLENEIAELNSFNISLEILDESKEKKIISSLGKGIHLQTSLEEKSLLVEVGSGVVVKKSIKDAREIIIGQIKKLEEAKFYLSGKMEIYNKSLYDMVKSVKN